MEWVTRREYDGVVVVSADRPPVNAMDVELLDELVAAVEELAAADPPPARRARRPARLFSAGLDLRRSPATARRAARAWSTASTGWRWASTGCPARSSAPSPAMRSPAASCWRCAETTGSPRRRAATASPRSRSGCPYPQGAIGVVRAELSAAARPRAGARQPPRRRPRVRADGRLRRGGRARRGSIARSVEVARELAELPADVYARTKAELRSRSRRWPSAAADPCSRPRRDPLLLTAAGPDSTAAGRSPAGGACVLRSRAGRAPRARRWLGPHSEPAREAALARAVRAGPVVEDGRLLLVAPGPGGVFLGLDGDRPLFATDGDPDRGHPAGLREAASELPAARGRAGRLRRLAACPGTGATASAPTAARRPRSPTPATSAAAPPAGRTTSRAPTRS